MLGVSNNAMQCEEGVYICVYVSICKSLVQLLENSMLLKKHRGRSDLSYFSHESIEAAVNLIIFKLLLELYCRRLYISFITLSSS